MNTKSDRDIRTGRAANLALFLVVVVGCVSTFIATPHLFTWPKTLLLIGLGALYSIVGTYGWACCERAASPAVRVLYFAFQILLGAAMVYRSGGFGPMALILFPLAAQGVVGLSRRWMLVICALILAVLVLPIGLGANWANAAQGFMGYLAALVFVVVFTQVAVNEQEARAEVERLAGELGEANLRLRQYAVQVEELATAQERNRLAREIHDGLGHYLTAINMQIQAALAVLESDRARALDGLGKAQSLTQDALADVRRSVAALRASPMEHRPLTEAVAASVDECRAAGILTALTVTGAARRLPQPVELTLYRAAQEGLTNLRKHAHASRADVVLDYGDEATVRLVVRDNGVGSSKTEGGFGLLGLRERVQLLGGQVRIRTAPRQGFTLEVEAPSETRRPGDKETRRQGDKETRGRG